MYCFNNIVYALAFYEGDLYAGGAFTTADGNPVGRIAHWDGVGWSTLGSGANGAVLTIEPAANQLLIGGSFTAAGGVAVNRFASWDGAAWSGFGTGADGSVMAIALTPTGTYVGGSFTMTGDHNADNVGRWNQIIATGVRDTAPPEHQLVLRQNYPNPFNPSTSVSYRIPAAGHVDVRVYDVRGRLVRNLVDGWRIAGDHTVTWQGRDDSGRAATTGVYFIRIESAGHSRTIKSLLLK